MSFKKSFKGAKSFPDSWTVSYELQVNGRKVVPETELSITGEAGRFRFIRHVRTGTSEWIDVVGGRKGWTMWRSFDQDRIRTVHWKNKTSKNIIKERKEEKSQNEQ